MMAPIVLFVYNRPWHTRQTVEALQCNELASESELYIYSDASRNEEAKSQVQQVRDYIKTVSGFKNITIIERDRNWGLAASIIDGVTSVVNRHGHVIVLEDDIVTSPFFIKYMNDALALYVNNDQVISIHGYVYPVDSSLPESFFLRGADCWGWATWKRGWEQFNPDGNFLLDELKRRHLIDGFDFHGSQNYSKMLAGQINGSNDSWAVRWYASAFLAEKLTLYPGRSLVFNIGNDCSGIHCGEDSSFDVTLSDRAIEVAAITVEPSVEAYLAFEHFFRNERLGWLRRIVRVARRIFKGMPR